MLAIGRHSIVNIGAEDQLLLRALASPRQFDSDKGRVLNSDPTPLRRRLQPEAAIGLAPEHAAEQADERQAANGRSAIIPSSVARDGDIEMTAIDENTPGRRGGLSARRNEPAGEIVERLCRRRLLRHDHPYM